MKNNSGVRWQLFITGKSILEDLVQQDLVSGNKKIVCFYRPIHLILINTNNGTELKLNDPENYRKCKFTEMLKAVIQEFLPKLYNRYVELNVKYVEKPIRYETTDQVKLLTICSTI